MNHTDHREDKGREPALASRASAPIELQTDICAKLAAIGGEPLEDSGFEEETPEEQFL